MLPPLPDDGAPPRFVIVMGVSGAGKTTVGRALADALGWPFHEGDDHHPAANVAKMARGDPLDDADRAPWLATLRETIARALHAGETGVLACSALKRSYRDALVPSAAPLGSVRFVFLDVPAEELESRMARRRGHYMPPSLLPSQLATLERPRGALRVDGTRAPGELVTTIRAELGL